MAGRFVRAFVSTSVILLLAAPLVLAAKRSDDVVVSYLEGTAAAFAPGAQKGVPLRQNDRVRTDREVRVGERSRLELRFPDGTVMRLGEKTAAALNHVSFQKTSGRKNYSVTLAAGKLWAHVKKLATPDSKVEVTTLNAVAGVRGTIYRVTIEGDTTALIRVYEGQVYVTRPPKEVPKPATEVSGPVQVPGPHQVPRPYREVTREEWHVIITSQQQVTVSPAGLVSVPEAFDVRTDSQDEWVRWNQERDRSLAF